MECVLCGNKDMSYFYKGHKGYYCRRCIGFSRVLLEEEPKSLEYEIGEGVDEYRFSYELTDIQKEASSRCASLIDSHDVLLHCVCGAGKTEISVASLGHYLKRGLKVAYAISRKEVVIELERRFSAIFPKARVVAVYGGHHELLTGDLIVCTTHQLYRYYKSFDLLVIDEADAFPLKGNETLMNIAINSCRGHIIFSTATVDDGLRKIIERRSCEKVEVFTRPSNRPLTMPRIMRMNKVFGMLMLIYLVVRMKGQCIVFMPSKKECMHMFRLISLFRKCTYAYSDLDRRDDNIKDFRDGKYQFIASTLVLERGITIKDVNVIICDYIEGIFDESNLIQMLGRVGRGIDSSCGKAYILTDRYGKKIRNVIRYLKEANSHLEMPILR